MQEEESETGGQLAAREEIVAQYQTTRVRFWSGYKRIFQLTRTGAQTLDPNTFSVTNTFPYTSITAISADENSPDVFSFTSNGTNYVYSTPFRAYLLCQFLECLVKSPTELLASYPHLSSPSLTNHKTSSITTNSSEEFTIESNQSSHGVRLFPPTGPFITNRLLKTEEQRPCRLLITAHALIELDSNTSLNIMKACGGDAIIREYHWVTLQKYGINRQYDVIFFEIASHTKIFFTKELDRLIHTIQSTIKRLGLYEKIPFLGEQQFIPIRQYRQQFYFNIPRVTTGHSYAVSKHSRRYGKRPIPRQLHISEEYLLETDTAGYRAHGVHRVNDVYAVIRHWSHPRRFSIEYIDGTTRDYTCAIREEVLAAILDACQANSNSRVIVTGEVSDGLRLIPRHAEEVYEASIKDAFFGASSIEAWYLGRLTKACKMIGPMLVAIAAASTSASTSASASAAVTTNSVSSTPNGLSSPTNPTENSLVSTMVSGFNQLTAAATLGGLGNPAMETTVYEAVVSACYEFNANVPCPGISSTTSDAISIRSTLVGLMRTMQFLLRECQMSDWTQIVSCRALVAVLQSVFRLLAHPVPYRSWVEVTEVDGSRLLLSLLRAKQPFVAYWALEVLAALCCGTTSQTFHGTTADNEKLKQEITQQEFVNKHALLTDSALVTLVSLLSSHAEDPNEVLNSTGTINFSTNSISNDSQDPNSESVNSGSSNSLLALGSARLLETLVCSHRETSSVELLIRPTLELLSRHINVLIGLLQSSSLLILEHSSILLCTLLRSRPAIRENICELALSDGLILRHLHAALYGISSTHRFLCRFLIATWCGNQSTSDGNSNNQVRKLIGRILPTGLLRFLNTPLVTEKNRREMDIWEDRFYASMSGNSNVGKELENGNTGSTRETKMRLRVANALKATPFTESTHTKIGGSVSNEFSPITTVPSSTTEPSTLLASPSLTGSVRQKRTPDNWRVLFHMATRDHSRPDFLWTAQTRLELRAALEAALTDWTAEQRVAIGSGRRIAWNYAQFGVSYASLLGELRVGDVFLRPLLQACQKERSSSSEASHDGMTGSGTGFDVPLDVHGSQWFHNLGVPPAVFFERLVRRMLILREASPETARQCVVVATRLVEAVGNELDTFEDMTLLLSVAREAVDRSLRVSLLELVSALALCQSDNLRQLVTPEMVAELIAYAQLACIVPTKVASMGAATWERRVLLEAKKTHDAPLQLTASDTPSRRVDSTSSSVTTTDTNSISNGTAWVPSDREAPAIWLIAPPDSPIPPPPHTQQGPYTVASLAARLLRKEITMSWLVCPTSSTNDDSSESLFLSNNVDTGAWHLLSSNFQLRYQTLPPGGDGGTDSTPTAVSCLSLRLLLTMLSRFAAQTSSGRVVYPLPTPNRLLLPHLSSLSSLLLASDDDVARLTAELLISVTRVSLQSPYTMTIYRSGLFYFALQRRSGDFQTIGRLLGLLHREQSIYLPPTTRLDSDSNDEEREESKGDRSTQKRSILADLLPSALLSALDAARDCPGEETSDTTNPLTITTPSRNGDGGESFARLFLAETETPSLRWGASYRTELLAALESHLGGFPSALRQHCTAVYDWLPLPSVRFTALSGELCVRQIYLATLLTPHWAHTFPLEKPLSLMTAVIRHWRRLSQPQNTDKRSSTEQTDDNVDGELNLAEALRTLEWSAGVEVNESSLRRAYRQAARRHHPDKNRGQGGERFAAIHRAFEFLVAADSIVLAAANRLAISGDFTVVFSDAVNGACEIQTDTTALAADVSEGIARREEQRRKVHISLCVRTVALLYRRCPEDFVAQRFPVYDLIQVALQVLPPLKPSDQTSPPNVGSNDNMESDILAMTLSAAEILAASLAGSPANAVDCARHGGARVAVNALLHALDALPFAAISEARSIAPDAELPSVVPINANSSHTYKISSEFEMDSPLALLASASAAAIGRLASVSEGVSALLEIGGGVVADALLRTITARVTIPAAADAALVAIAALTVNPSLQTSLAATGAAWRLLPPILGYHANIGVTSSDKNSTEYVSHDPNDGSKRGGYSQIIANRHAEWSAIALRRLAGYDTTDNSAISAAPSKAVSNNPCAQPAVQRFLSALFTPPLASQLAHAKTRARLTAWLTALSTGIESADAVWTSAMAIQLTGGLLIAAKALDQANAETIYPICLPPDQRLEIFVKAASDATLQLATAASEWRYASLATELRVGDVYVGILVRGGATATSNLRHPRHTFAALVCWLEEVTSTEVDLQKFSRFGGLDNFRRMLIGDGEVLPATEWLVNGDPSDTTISLAVSAVALLSDSPVTSLFSGSESSTSVGVLCGLLCRLITRLPLGSSAAQQASELFGRLMCRYSIAVSGLIRTGGVEEGRESLCRLVAILTSIFPLSETSTTSSLTNNVSGGVLSAIWDALDALLANGEGAMAWLSVGGDTWLLALAMSGVDGLNVSFSSRRRAAAALGVLLWSPSVGPLSAETLCRLLPPPLVSTLRAAIAVTGAASGTTPLANGSFSGSGPGGANSECGAAVGSGGSGEAALTLLESTTETPELLWTPAMRMTLRSQLTAILKVPLASIHNRQWQAVSAVLPAGFSVSFPSLSGESCVGGVYLRRLLRQPTWRLTAPLRLLEALVAAWESSAKEAHSNLQNALANATKHAAENIGTLVDLSDASTALVSNLQNSSEDPADGLPLITETLLCLIRTDNSASTNLTTWSFPSAVAQIVIASSKTAVPISPPTIFSSSNTLCEPLSSALRLLCALTTRTDGLDTLAESLPNQSIKSTSRSRSTATLLLHALIAALHFPPPNSHVLTAHTPLVISLLCQIFQVSIAARSGMQWIHTAHEAQLPTVLLDSVLGASSDSFSVILGNSNGGSVEAIRLRAADTLRALLGADRNEVSAARLQNLLDSHPAWHEFRGQRHDLCSSAAAAPVKHLQLTNGTGPHLLTASKVSPPVAETWAPAALAPVPVFSPPPDILEHAPVKPPPVMERSNNEWVPQDTLNPSLMMPPLAPFSPIEVGSSTLEFPSVPVTTSIISPPVPAPSTAVDPFGDLILSSAPPLLSAPSVTAPVAAPVTAPVTVHVPVPATVPATVPAAAPATVPAAVPATVPAAAPAARLFRVSLEKGPLGVGLELQRSPEGLASIVRLKNLGPDVINPASVCQPKLGVGDLLVGVNGVRCPTFADLVRAIRGTPDGILSIDILRRDTDTPTILL